MHSRGTRNQYLTVALQTTRPEEVLQKINAQSAKILQADVVGEDQRPPVLTMLYLSSYYLSLNSRSSAQYVLRPEKSNI